MLDIPPLPDRTILLVEVGSTAHGTGIELLTTRCLTLPIQGEPADWLRAVRRGEVSFDD